MENETKFTWALLQKEYKPILIGLGIFFILLFFEKVSFPLSFVSGIFCFFLLIIGILDIRYGLIFNKFLIIFLATFFMLFLWQDRIFPPLFNGFLASFICAFIFLLIQILSKGGVGGGDIKFIFCLGFWLGLNKLFLAIYIAIVSALIFVIIKKFLKDKNKIIPFGPFLSLGAIISFLYGEKILVLYKECLL